MKTLTTRSQSGYAEALETRAPFKTSGNLRGIIGANIDTGYLPSRFASEYRARYAHITYTVLSYGTPIAWHDDELGWIVPDVNYSTSTSRHQSRVRGGLPIGGYDTAPRA